MLCWGDIICLKKYLFWDFCHVIISKLQEMQEEDGHKPESVSYMCTQLSHKELLHFE